MMQGAFLIDGLDSFSEYGVWVEKGGYKGLLQYPAFKTLDVTTWPDDDGDEVDLEAVTLDTRSLQLQFCIRDVRYAEDFFNDLANGAYHTFAFPELGGRTYRLRMTQNGTFSQCLRLGKLTLTFSDDFPPAIPATTPAPPFANGSPEINQPGYAIDGLTLSHYGAIVLKGTDENIRRAPDTKENLKTTNAATPGVTYDAACVNFKSKDVTLKLLIRCNGMTEFWRRYDALFGALLQPGAHVFTFGALAMDYDCYYKGASVQRFDILRGERVWCELDVTLAFTSPRPAMQYMLLATEADALVATEADDVIIIRPKSGISLLAAQDGSLIITETNDTIFVNNTY